VYIYEQIHVDTTLEKEEEEEDNEESEHQL
jgi:hypothetical protein